MFKKTTNDEGQLLDIFLLTFNLSKKNASIIFIAYKGFYIF